MSEKIYTRLFRLYPLSFRKEYEDEVLQLIRDRLQDETGFFKRARLWWDLIVDVFAGLPSAYRNSHAVTLAASLSLDAAGIPSFKLLEKEPLGRGSILVGSTISLIALAAFVFVLSRPIAYQPLSGPNGRMSPIEAVLQRLNRAPEPDSAESDLQDAAAPASSSGAVIPNGEGNRAYSTQMQNLNEHSVELKNAPKALESFPQEFANGPTAVVRSSSHDSLIVAEHGQIPIPTGQPRLHDAANAMTRLTKTLDIADTWQGTLHAGKDLRTVIKITKAYGGGYSAAFYSIDQSGSPFPVTNITLGGGIVKYNVIAFHLTYEGKLSADGKTIGGTSTQGTISLPLAFARSTPETAWAIPGPPPVIPRRATNARPRP